MKLEGLLGVPTKDLGLRFNLVGLMPMFTLMIFWLCLSWSGAWEEAPQVGRISERVKELNTAQGAVLLFSLLIFAAALHPLQTNFLRLLEGYWGNGPFASTLTRIGIKRQLKARQVLVQEAMARVEDPNYITPEKYERMNVAAYQLYHRYPSEQRLLPTALGNLLRAAEARPEDYYGLDALVTWPCMVPFFSDGLKATLYDLRNQLDFTARMAVTFTACAALGVIYLYRWDWWLLVPAGALVLALLSYRAALAAALLYSEAIQSAYHLHRFDLLTALHLPLPKDRAEELQANRQLSDFLKNRVGNLAYRHYVREESK